jgi:hypothetical protein
MNRRIIAALATGAATLATVAVLATNGANASPAAPAVAADAEQARAAIAPYLPGPATAEVVKADGRDVLDALFPGEDVAGDEAAELADKPLIVTKATGAPYLGAVPIPPDSGITADQFRSITVVSDPVTGRIVTVVLAGKSDPPDKDDIAKVGKPERADVTADDIAKARPPK